MFVVSCANRRDRHLLLLLLLLFFVEKIGFRFFLVCGVNLGANANANVNANASNSASPDSQDRWIGRPGGPSNRPTISKQQNFPFCKMQSQENRSKNTKKY